ncbi:MAG TPA: hypothetical protein VFL34_10525 [Candidatus Sulfotelmatobacter sp.]|nr:hypothetical protein [Candidatus Sulfotelmatobacter sp.]
MKRFLLLGLLLATECPALTYYVSNAGSDSNPGTSTALPWQTLAHVNAQSFSAGDTIKLQRGGTWNEPLIVPSSGASGNPITFDAYGTGPAPILSGAAPPLTWTYNSGNIWTATLPAAPASATVLNMQFGSLWGQYKAPVSSSCLAAGVIVSSRDFCSYGGILYVYDSSSTNAPAVFYGTTVTPILTVSAGYQLISINSKKYLTFQHLKLVNFDQQGVLVWAASDFIVFANMEVDGIVPYGTTPLGFYINATSPTSIQFYNVEVRAHDYGWGPANSRNLLGRFSTRTFSLPRLGRAQTYFLRLYDNSSPPRYSRYATALHVDYPL